MFTGNLQLIFSSPWEIKPYLHLIFSFTTHLHLIYISPCEFTPHLQLTYTSPCEFTTHLQVIYTSFTPHHVNLRLIYCTRHHISNSFTPHHVNLQLIYSTTHLRPFCNSPTSLRSLHPILHPSPTYRSPTSPPYGLRDYRQERGGHAILPIWVVFVLGQVVYMDLAGG